MKRLAASKHRSTLLLLATYVASRLSRGRHERPAARAPAPVGPAAAAGAAAPTGGRGEPRELRDLPASGWRATFRRTVKEFRADDLTDWAAALTYYAVLSLFPSVIVLISILGLAGQYPQTSDALLRIVGEVGPSSAVDTFRGPIEDVVKAKGGAGALLGFGLVGAIWSASGYTGAFFRAANVVYETREGRPFWKLRPLQVLVTTVMTLLLALVAIAIVVTGGLAQAVGDVIGLGSGTVTVWNWAKWPALLVILAGMIAALYYVAPNVRQPALRWVTPGSAIALVTWILASGLFGIYVSQFGSYNKTYGTLGGVIVFLTWLWVSNVALLFGLEFDAELERSRELAAGDRRALDEIQLEPRAEPKPA
ncbi:MAG TPA: YihY/virulence factor BrkB family protein [Gaiellales bacterium]